MKIGLFYGSSTCYTEMAAEKSVRFWVKTGRPAQPERRLSQADGGLFHSDPRYPDRDFGELQEDWEAIWPQLPALDLKGKIVAMYGMGDQLGYGEWFLDALGMLHDQIAPLGVQFVGFWPTDGFEFTSPKPLSADGKHFVGGAR